jgi:hypothetical protein
VQTVLAQFPPGRVRVIALGNLRFAAQIDEAVVKAQALGAIIVHTLVDAGLRARLISLANERGIPQIDLMGPLLTTLTEILGEAPFGKPGLYRQLNRPYFDRIAAIDFAMAHDDGKDPSAWPQAEVLLVGVSRVSKTPLSLYLSVLGWKIANMPIVPGLALPAELFQIDRRRVIGLTIAPGQLVQLRQQRQSRLGVSGASPYTDPQKVYEEIEYAREVCQRGGFSVLDVTDKPIESTADEIIRLIGSRFAIQDRGDLESDRP